MRRTARQSGNRQSLLSSYTEMYGDIVLRHRARLAETALRIEAEARDKAKSQFIANMSHELRTPLNAIIGFSQIMRGADKQPVTTEQVVEYSGYINDTAEHLLHIINDLLDMSKIQSGKQTITLDDLDISELIRGCFTLIASAAKEKNIELINDIDDDFPLFPADALRLKQVFSNLLSNAVKCTGENGTVTVSARVVGDKVELRVIDTGCGMTPSEIETAKKPFEQVDGNLDRSINGTGLGIPIASGFIKLHNGTFEIESKKDVGTTIIITLPKEQDSIIQESSCAT